MAEPPMWRPHAGKGFSTDPKASACHGQVVLDCEWRSPSEGGPNKAKRLLDVSHI